MAILFPIAQLTLFYSWAKPGSEHVLLRVSGRSETEQSGTRTRDELWSEHSGKEALSNCMYN